MRKAVATSLVIIALKSYTGFTKYWQVISNDADLSLDWQVIGIMVILGGIGSSIGNKIANKIPQQKLKSLFGLFLVLMAIYILIKSTPKLF